jgi:acyl-CoA reductase-like NAD-dependent aldehyde dehydrogenase
MWRNVVDSALRKNGVPVGTMNIVIGNTSKYIKQWIKSPLVNDIIYFGESERGLTIGKEIYSAGKKPILELSGKDIVVVWSDADLNKAAESLLDCFLGSTQICMVPKMALIHESVHDDFLKIFIEKVKTLKVGLPSNPETCLSPVSKISVFRDFLNDAMSHGADLVFGSRQLNYLGVPDEHGVYLEPTVISIDDSRTSMKLKCIEEENFFPLLPIVKITSKDTHRSGGPVNKNQRILEKILTLLNKNNFGLRVSVWAKSDSVVRKFIQRTNHCGLLHINTQHVEFSKFLATHGGPGKTGGPYGELNYFWQKTTHLQGISIKS